MQEHENEDGPEQVPLGAVNMTNVHRHSFCREAIILKTLEKYEKCILNHTKS